MNFVIIVIIIIITIYESGIGEAVRRFGVRKPELKARVRIAMEKNNFWTVMIDAPTQSGRSSSP